jgi:hypothetical protein
VGHFSIGPGDPPDKDADCLRFRASRRSDQSSHFGEAVTGRSRVDYGLPHDSKDSFLLDSSDTIASVSADYRAAVERSHSAIEGMGLDTVLTGHPAGPMPLRWVLLHVLRELAQHCGHADILREQILAERERRGCWSGIAR